MPCGDGTGPLLQGRDRCSRQSNHSEIDNSCCDHGRHSGRGFRTGKSFDTPWREPTPAEEMSYLEDMARRMEEDLKGIRERIEKLRPSQ